MQTAWNPRCWNFQPLPPSLSLDFPRMLAAQHARPARIGVHLAAVQCHHAQLQNLHLRSYFQHIDHQRLDLFQKSPAERDLRVIVGVLVASGEVKRQRVMRRAFQLAAG